MGICGTSFQLFWGEVRNEKKYWKPVPPCFWHVAKIFFLMGNYFWDFTCDRKIFCQKWKYFSPPKKKSREKFTCDRHLILPLPANNRCNTVVPFYHSCKNYTNIVSIKTPQDSQLLLYIANLFHLCSVYSICAMYISSHSSVRHPQVVGGGGDLQFIHW